jgi:hypothetical protein
MRDHPFNKDIFVNISVLFYIDNRLNLISYFLVRLLSVTQIKRVRVNVFNATIFQFHRGGQIYFWRKPGKKTTNLSQVSDNLYL